MSFFQKLLLFHIPLGILFIGAVAVAIYSGEAMPPRMVYETQLQYPGTLYNTTHHYQDFAYKYYAFERLKPEVLFLGASRLAAFRASFFNRDPSVGYNAALPTYVMSHLETFINQITPENAPKVIIFQVDQFWFNADWPGYTASRPTQLTEYEFDHVIGVTRQMIRTLNGEIAFDRILRRTNPVSGQLALGIPPIRGGNGFAVDGAMEHISMSHSPQEQSKTLNDALNLLREGQIHFKPGDRVREEALVRLSAMLDKAAALDIEVIGFAPGFMPTVYQEMMEAGQHTYMDKAMPRVAAVFEEHGFHFFDFTHLTTDMADREFLDGNHPYEMAALKMYMKMVEGAPEILGPYSDLEGLQRMLDNAVSPSEVVPREYRNPPAP